MKEILLPAHELPPLHVLSSFRPLQRRLAGCKFVRQPVPVHARIGCGLIRTRRGGWAVSTTSFNADERCSGPWLSGYGQEARRDAQDLGERRLPLPRPFAEPERLPPRRARPCHEAVSRDRCAVRVEGTHLHRRLQHGRSGDTRLRTKSRRPCSDQGCFPYFHPEPWDSLGALHAEPESEATCRRQ